MPGRDRAPADRRRCGALLAAAVALAAAEGVGGLLLAYHLDLPPGPAIAVLGGGVFALAALAGAPARAR